MSTELMRVTATEAISLGKQFHESGMFPDIKSAQQAVVKIMAGSEIGIPPFASMAGIHIIQGKPTIGAGVIASAIKGSGKYDYRVTKQDEKVCSIDFYQGKEIIGNSTFTIEDAKKAQTKNLDRFPRNMLFARAISNGVKWFCPDVFSGPVYVPEEMQEVTIDTVAEVTDPIYDDALAAIYAAEDLNTLQSVWTSHKDLQSRPEFKAAKDEVKKKLQAVGKRLEDLKHEAEA